MARTYTKNFNHDASRKIIMTSGGIATQDGTATPKASPLAIDTNVTTLTVPENAAEIVLKGSTIIRVSEDSTMTRYYTQPANQALAIGVADSSFIYVRTASGSGTLDFYFNTI